MLPYQSRVVGESRELGIKIELLSEWLADDKFKTVPTDEQARLCRQLHVMREYKIILDQRIKHFA